MLLAPGPVPGVFSLNFKITSKMSLRGIFFVALDAKNDEAISFVQIVRGCFNYSDFVFVSIFGIRISDFK
jgi:hypothetical protein